MTGGDATVILVPTTLTFSLDGPWIKSISGSRWPPLASLTIALIIHRPPFQLIVPRRASRRRRMVRSRLRPATVRLSARRGFETASCTRETGFLTVILAFCTAGADPRLGAWVKRTALLLVPSPFGLELPEIHPLLTLPRRG